MQSAGKGNGVPRTAAGDYGGSGLRGIAAGCGGIFQKHYELHSAFAFLREALRIIRIYTYKIAALFFISYFLNAHFFRTF